MEYTSFTKSNTVTDEMKINLNMFGSLVLDGVGRHVHGADIVTIDHCSSGRGVMELLEKLPKPA
jgi:hypothetical protein